MLVKGETAPTEYERYYDYFLDTQIETLNARVDRLTKPVYYHADGDVLDVIYKYSAAKDMRVRLKKKGGNNLFDFYQFAFIDNATEFVWSDYGGGTIAVTTTSDWHSPFVMAAKSDIDGDAVSFRPFYRRQSRIYQYRRRRHADPQPAARSSSFLPTEGKLRTRRAAAERIEAVWTNYVQAYNTKKSDGTGREVLRECHRLLFDGVRFLVHVDLVPLEDVTVATWYGFQCTTLSPWRGTGHYIRRDEPRDVRRFGGDRLRR